MEAIAFFPESDGLSAETIQNLILRHVLRTTVQALVRAEWIRLQTALFGRGHPPSRALPAIKKIGTPVGKIRIEMPNDRDIKFRSCLLCSSQRELQIPIERLLVLPFVENEKALTAALEQIFGEAMPHDLVRVFITCLAELLRSEQESKLHNSYSRGYFGECNVLAGLGSEDEGLIDYGILRDPRGHHFVCGIWDPLQGKPERWKEIAAALQRRGIHSITEVITDKARDQFELEQAILETELKHEEPESHPEELARAVEALHEVEETQVFEWTGRKSDPIFDPPSIATEFVPREPLASQLDAENNEPAVGYTLVGYARDTAIAFTVALVLMLGVVVGYKYVAQGLTYESVVATIESLRGAAPQVKNDPVFEAKVMIQPFTRREQLSDPAVQAALMSLSNHRDFQVRIAVVKAISGNELLSVGERVLFLGKMLDDKDYLVRGFSAKLLGQFGTPEAYQFLRDREPNEPSQVVLAVIRKLIHP
jgi:hypothetical protein